VRTKDGTTHRRISASGAACSGSWWALEGRGIEINRAELRSVSGRMPRRRETKHADAQRHECRATQRTGAIGVLVVLIVLIVWARRNAVTGHGCVQVFAVGSDGAGRVAGLRGPR